MARGVVCVKSGAAGVEVFPHFFPSDIEDWAGKRMAEATIGRERMVGDSPKTVDDGIAVARAMTKRKSGVGYGVYKEVAYCFQGMEER